MTPYYERDGIIIYHGDCLEVLPQLDAANHVITDPPYFKDVYLRAAAPATKVGSGTPARLGATLHKLAAGDIGVLTEGMASDLALHFARLARRWVLVFSDVENCHVWRLAMTAAGLRYARTGAWVKPDSMPQMSGDRPAVGFEPATIMHAPGPMGWNGGGNRALWTHGIARGDQRHGHPCPKPVALMEEILTQYTDEGELVIDPFMGQGTTLEAARRTGRRAIGIEREERWCEAAALRLEHGDAIATRIRAGHIPLPFEVPA